MKKVQRPIVQFNRMPFVFILFIQYQRISELLCPGPSMIFCLNKNSHFFTIKDSPIFLAVAEEFRNSRVRNSRLKS